MNGMTAETMLGALAGLAVAVILIGVLIRARVLDMTFDERQERARGTAYKYAFIATLVTAALYGGSELLLGRWCDAMTGAVLCFCVGGGVFASTCIVKGAYVSLREKPRRSRRGDPTLERAGDDLGAGHLLRTPGASCD